MTDTAFGQVVTAAQDAETAVREGEAAFAAAKAVLGLDDLRFVIVDAALGSTQWGDLSDDGAPIYPWVFASSVTDGAPRAPDYVLRHEIGHDLFVRYLAPSTQADQYGGDAPDWLDEMAAVAFEGVEQQTARRRSVVLYQRAGRLLPLGDFLTMTHPEMTGDLPDVASGELFQVRRSMSQDTGPFYAMARAFYDFLVARTGDSSIVAALAGAMREGEPLDRWILDRTGHGDAGSVEALNKDFLAWIDADPRYRGDRLSGS
ncbi:hypothetical protein E4M02_08765 [Brevundimonas sp. S30B]|uniref:hypothetical protein n=1 Tax=unclassified Brevundimonas TaxID=2622653 RepID=UPI001072ED24|nr:MULTISPECIES: hypothetical protein [unclassified Brevundimonas]QBX38447.1 hypothetical protein E4M01_12200 [Brevundimonas sp. MF30-B]TFW02156.1 hypothetical protein E4M02_08765 [Brevundimonas sp. S30B]